MPARLADVEVYDRTAGRTLPVHEHRGPPVRRRRTAAPVRAAHPQSLRRARAGGDQRRRRERHHAAKRRPNSRAATCIDAWDSRRRSKAGARAWTMSPRSTSRACATRTPRAPAGPTTSASSASRCSANSRYLLLRSIRQDRRRTTPHRRAAASRRSRPQADAVARATSAIETRHRSRPSRSLTGAIRRLPARLDARPTRPSSSTTTRSKNLVAQGVIPPSTRRYARAIGRIRFPTSFVPDP